jgi:hypothetical protein
MKSIKPTSNYIDPEEETEQLTAQATGIETPGLACN